MGTLAARPATDAAAKRDQKATADADRRPRKVEEATPLTRKVRQAKRDARAARKKAEKRARLLVKLTPLLVRCGADTVALYFRAWRRPSVPLRLPHLASEGRGLLDFPRSAIGVRGGFLIALRRGVRGWSSS